MTIQIPDNRKEIENAAKADVQAELQNSNPYLRRSFLLSIIRAISGRTFDFYNQLRQLLLAIFPNTATGEFLDMWGSWVGLARNPATVSDGFVNFLGTVGINIPAGTPVSSSDGRAYTTQAATLIATDSLDITLLERSASIATATTDEPHNLGTGMQVEILGATETEYNGTVTITVTAPDEFQYTVSGTPTSPATGTITAEIDRALINCESDEFGADQNLAGGSSLTLGTPIAGVNSVAIVGNSGIDGGTDAETDQSYRNRVQRRFANPLTLFNVPAIVEQCETVAGVSRVWVFEVTPEIGDVTIYFVRDNDPGGIIPSAGEVQDVKDAVLLITPANTDPSRVFVEAPVANTVNFNFSSISPDSVSMRDAVAESLTQFFREDVTVGQNVTADDYRSAIINTLDPTTGASLDSFTLLTPTGDIVIAANEIPILGTVTF